MKPGHGAVFVRINQYARDRYNLLVNQARCALSDSLLDMSLAGSAWRVAMKSCAVVGDSDAKDIEISFSCESGALNAASVSVDLEFSAWSPSNYVLMPAAVYAGNRFLSRRIPYSPKLCLVDDIGSDKPTIVTDIPKLNERDGPSRIQERSGSMAVPCVGFQSNQSDSGFLLLTSQGNSLGDYGIDIEENRDRDKMCISITAPLVRESYSYRMCDMRFPSVDVPRDFKEGDEVTITFRTHSFIAQDVQSLFEKFGKIRKPVVFPHVNVLPFSACFALLEKKFNCTNFVPEHGYYSVGLRQNFLQDWQIGWTGGMISTYPLLFAGDENTRKRVLRNFDWLFPNGISPSGFFWDSGANGTEWFGGDVRKPHTANWHLIRKSADAVFFIIKQFLLMEKLGIEVKSAWQDGTRGVCDAFVKLWRENQQFGQFVDSLTGEIRVGGSTSAAIAPAALSLAGNYFSEPRYGQVAVESAEYFYQNYTRAGLSCGGPGDALQNPDSESLAAMIESYVALHDATGDHRWIDRAREAVRQFSSWVVSYNFQFPTDSMFGKASIRTTGSVYANTQNKHSAPGVCTLSGLGLLKIFRATGDLFSLDILRDIAHGLPQYLPHPLKPLGDAVIGHMCERVNMGDWEGPDRIGETLRMTTWAETALMLTCIEIPGLYVQPERSLVVIFDHITAEIIWDDEVNLKLRIANPTNAFVILKILVESNVEALRPLPENALFGGRAIELEAGTSIILDFPKSFH